MSYVAPKFKKTAFNCPYCNAYAKMFWTNIVNPTGRSFITTPVHQANCAHCNEKSYWLETKYMDSITGHILIPPKTIAPLPHPDMPENVKTDYEEARSISSKSSRGAAALLRLAIQKLCVHLGEKGKNINDDIGALVKKGLPVQIQKSLDIVRVIGNNAVHPGELSSKDVAEVADTLFELANHIVEEMISRPKKT